MSDKTVDDALDGLSDTLSMVDSARHALASTLEEMHQILPDRACVAVGFCVLRTLDAAAEQGHASFDIV